MRIWHNYAINAMLFSFLTQFWVLLMVVAGSIFNECNGLSVSSFGKTIFSITSKGLEGGSLICKGSFQKVTATIALWKLVAIFTIFFPCMGMDKFLPRAIPSTTKDICNNFFYQYLHLFKYKNSSCTSTRSSLFDFRKEHCAPGTWMRIEHSDNCFGSQI